MATVPGCHCQRLLAPARVEERERQERDDRRDERAQQPEGPDPQPESAGGGNRGRHRRRHRADHGGDDDSGQLVARDEHEVECDVRGEQQTRQTPARRLATLAPEAAASALGTVSSSRCSCMAMTRSLVDQRQ